MSCAAIQAKDALQWGCLRPGPGVGLRVSEQPQGAQCGWRRVRGRGRAVGCQAMGELDPGGPGEWLGHEVACDGVWSSRPCHVGEKLKEQLGACHQDAGQTGVAQKRKV